MMDPLIGVRLVSFIRPTDATPVLQDIDFRVFEGDRIALLGPNGCGKTTLLKLLLGRLKPTSGEVTVAPLRIGYVDQELVLFPWMSVKKNILFGLNRQGVTKERQALLFAKLRKLVEVDDIIGKYPMRLSGGMRQRAVLARTLLDSPELMLLDEPFSALDSSTKAGLYDLFGGLRVTLLVVTHDPTEAVRLSNRIILLSGGDGKPGRIMAELTLDKDDPVSRSRSEETLRLLMAHSAEERVSEDELLGLEASTKPGDRVVILASGIDRLRESERSLNVMCVNLSRGIKYLYCLPDASGPSIADCIGRIRALSDASREIASQNLEIRSTPTLDSQSHSYEYILIESSGAPIVGWQYVVPYDRRYVVTLNRDTLLHLAQIIEQRQHSGAPQ